jgi:hypothetical protein
MIYLEPDVRHRSLTVSVVCLLLVASPLVFTRWAPASAIDYSSMTYNFRVNFSFEVNVKAAAAAHADVTSSLNFNVTLSQPSQGGLSGQTVAQGNYSGTYYLDKQPPAFYGATCPSSSQILGKFVVSISAIAGTSSAPNNASLTLSVVSDNETDSPVLPENCYNFHGSGYTASESNDNIILDCSYAPPVDISNNYCQYTIQGGSAKFSAKPGNYASITSASGNAVLSLVGTVSRSSTSSSSSSTSSSSTSSTTNTSSTGGPQVAHCLIQKAAFRPSLWGVRTIPSGTTYVNTIFDNDTFFIDGILPPLAATDVFPAGCQYSLSLIITVTITGADGISFQYGAPSSSPFTTIPTTWVTLSPPSSPGQRPLGLWQAVATVQITQSDAAGTVDLGTLSSDPLPFVVASHLPTGFIDVVGKDGKPGSIVTFGTIAGNVQGNLSFAQATGLPTLSFSVTGTSGSSGYLTALIPKTLVGYGLTPAVIVNGVRLPFTTSSIPATGGSGVSASFAQNNNDYVIRLQVHFSTDAVEVDFANAVPVPEFNADGILLALTVSLAFIALAVGRQKNIHAQSDV